MSVHSSIIVGPYDWVEVGAYARYVISEPGLPILALSNGSIREPRELDYSVFQWTIIEKQERIVHLNVTISLNGTGWSRDPGTPPRWSNITYRKTVFVKVDIYTRESFIENESIGLTCFWAEPYLEEGDKVTLYSNPDLIIGKVKWVMTDDDFITGKEAKMYGTPGSNCVPDPHVFGSNYIFSWYTGVAWQMTVLGPSYEVPSNMIGNFLCSCNGSSINVTRYGGSKLGAYLGLYHCPGQNMIWATLVETNIDLALETSKESQPNSNSDISSNDQTGISDSQLEPNGQTNVSDFWVYFSFSCILICILLPPIFILKRRRNAHTRIK